MEIVLSRKYLEDLEYRVVGACIEVHRILGPGLLESVYHQCMAHELGIRGIHFTSEQTLVLDYKGVQVVTALRYDFCIEGCMMLEMKAVQAVLPIHEAQLISYMKILKVPKGLLVNFHVANIVSEGRKSYVNEYYRTLS